MQRKIINNPDTNAKSLLRIRKGILLEILFELGAYEEEELIGQKRRNLFQMKCFSKKGRHFSVIS